jgi:hypothetical protein
VVCDYCRSAIARTDRALEDLGKVAALVDTGSPLRRDLPGKYHGTGFRIVGRTQMQHQAGGVWDEWYAVFDDGRWGWLAEAQGKYYVTFKSTARDLPSREQIAVGGRLDGMVITEIGTATLISGEGEIPFKVVPGSEYHYADLSGDKQRFATIDYSEERPLLFKGEETTLRELGIEVEPARQRGVRVEKVSCSKCGGSLNLVAPDQAERVICPNCGAMHEVAEGNLRFLEVLKQRGPKPRLKLGSRGKINGDEYAVAGFMLRSVTFDQKYLWTEYLLFNREKGFRWLVESDDHWSFVRPIPAGEVKSVFVPRINWQGKTFSIFQDAQATVEHVLGEFYWKVSVGEKVRAIDYIAPPEGISVESSDEDRASEVNYSLARYMTVDEVEQAFGVKNLPRPVKVGPLQPNPGGGPTRVAGLWAKFVVALLVVAIILMITRSRREVLTDTYHFGPPDIGGWTPIQPASASPESSRVVFTKPFTLSGGRNLKIEGFSDASNSWIYVAGDLVDQRGRIVDVFDLPIEYYEGVDGGERWSEGSRTRNVYLPALPAGQYTMRLEGQWDPKLSNPRMEIRLKEGVFRWSHLFLAFLALTVPATLLAFRPMTFEKQRWEESMFTPQGILRSGDDEHDQ